MKFTSVHVQNFKGLKDVTVPLSQFGCLIGENNSGKSSVLQALLLLLPSSTKKPATSDFFDPTKSVRIELRLEGIDEHDLERISNPQHRASFEPDIVDGAVRIVRIFDSAATTKSQLHVSRLVPADPRWSDATLLPAMKGKSGTELRSLVVDQIPELDPDLSDKPTQKEILALRDDFVAAMGDEEKEYKDVPLATGLDAGIKNFLPEPIYIETVKDVADEVKTSDTATFGKLLGLLLDEVQDKFADVDEQFKSIQRQLSRVVDVSGEIVDDRIAEVRSVEELLNKYVKQSFPDVELTMSVPVPKMKTILSSAEISANDGHDGPISAKGDGLKRAVAFAILRAYTSLRSSGIANADVSPGHYWLLFEEPELYLYPRAQRQLFRALEVFSSEFPVLVTTHSPAFFDANSTQSFVKFEKVQQSVSESPCSKVHPIEIGDDLAMKTTFQIICHENNSIGFFAKQVVLVEGDSDVVLFPHVAKLLNPEWDATERNIAFARTNGKGNIQNYRSFFGNFDIPVHVICDLDALIVGFDKLNPTSEAAACRDALFATLDSELSEAAAITESSAKTIVGSGEARALWRIAEEAREALDGSAEKLAELSSAIDAFFKFRRKDDRLSVLKASGGDLDECKQKLINLLRESRTHVLSRGAIEDYYASASKNRDKVEQAIRYRADCGSLEKFRADLGEDAEKIEAELRTIFDSIFGSLEPVTLI